MELKRIIHVETEDYDPSFYPIPQDLKPDLSICYRNTDQQLLSKVGIYAPTVHGTYIRDPFNDDIYYPIECYELNSWLSKMHHIFEIIRRLGATEARFSGKNVVVKERQIDWNGSGQVIGLGDAEASIFKTEEAKISQEISQVSRFSSNATLPTIEEYNNVVEYAKKHHLYNNPSIRSLLDSRNPSQENLLEEKNYHCSLSEETNEGLKLAIKLGVNSAGLTVDQEFKNTVKYQKSIEFDFSVIFSQRRTNS